MTSRRQSEVVRREPLLWVTSANHAVHEQDAAAAGLRPADLHLAARRPAMCSTR